MARFSYHHLSGGAELGLKFLIAVVAKVEFSATVVRLFSPRTTNSASTSPRATKYILLQGSRHLKIDLSGDRERVCAFKISHSGNRSEQSENEQPPGKH
jgi:hypothetical protein